MGKLSDKWGILKIKKMINFVEIASYLKKFVYTIYSIQKM